jgi:tetratricopeptide (TPR) repeat protein
MVIAIFVFLIVFNAVLLLPKDSRTMIGIKEGDAPKSFTLENINGSSFDLAQFVGQKPVILVFWKTMESKSFLDYSLDELLFLEDFYKEHHEKSGLEIVGIYTPKQDKEIPDEEIKNVKDLVQVNKITYPVLLDQDFRVFREYGVIALPSTVMIGKTGKVTFIYPSFPMSAKQLIEEEILELLGIRKAVEKKSPDQAKGATPESTRLYRYALQMYRKGLIEQSLSPLKKSLSIDPDFTWAHNLMGVILWERGDVKNAQQEFIRAIELKKDIAQVHYNYGLLLYDREDYGEALKHLRRSVEINAKIPEAHYILGLLFRDMNRNDEALQELTSAQDLIESTEGGREIPYGGYLRISTLYSLSELYQQAGDREKAFLLLRDAVRIAMGRDAAEGTGKIYKERKLMIYE